MTNNTDRPDDWFKIADGGKYRWQWRGWTSAAFAYLEERPWTPLVIADRLCFTAEEGGQWCVVWGDAIGPWYDDVADTSELAGQPVYVARVGSEWFVVWGAKHSGRFQHQIRYKLDGDNIAIYGFDTERGTVGSSLDPHWSSQT